MSHPKFELEKAKAGIEDEVLQKMGGWKEALIDKVVGLMGSGDDGGVLGATTTGKNPFQTSSHGVSQKSNVAKGLEGSPPHIQRHCWALEIALQEVTEKLNQAKLQSNALFEQNAQLKAHLEKNTSVDTDSKKPFAPPPRGLTGGDHEFAVPSLTNWLSRIEQQQRNLEETTYAANVALQKDRTTKFKNEIRDLKLEIEKLLCDKANAAIEKRQLIERAESEKDELNVRIRSMITGGRENDFRKLSHLPVQFTFGS